MARVLVIDDESHIREVLARSLSKHGHEVIEARDGRVGLEKAWAERPDAIILDVSMPALDGFEVLKRLRENPNTGATPVILLTTFPDVEGERAGMDLGANHYIPKPWDPQTLELTLRVALREGAGERGIRDEGGLPAAQRPNIIKLPDQLRPLEQKLEGGVPLHSLTLMEVSSSAGGSSALCQYLAYGALLDGYRVAYFTSEGAARSVPRQMEYIGLSTAGFLREGQLAVFTIQEPNPDDDAGPLLGALALDMERLPQQYQLIVVDAVTTLATYSQEQRIAAFFSSCKRLSGRGRTVIAVAHAYAFNENMLIRLRDLCDVHLRVQSRKVRARPIQTLEVAKLNGIATGGDSVLSFQVEPGYGIRVAPFSQVKI